MDARSTLESIAQDVRQGWRSLLNSPATFSLAVLTIALAIGSITAVFTAVDRVLFRDLPYPHPERLVMFGVRAPLDKNTFLLEGGYWEYRERQNVFDSMGAMSATGDCDITERNPVRLHCNSVSASFLHTFGVAPILGRDFTPSEDVRGGPNVALISYGLWERRYGRDPAAVGQGIRINGKSTQIIGVLPKDFEMPNLATVDILLPQQLRIAPHVAGNFMRAYGRLKRGISVAQARAALQPIFTALLEDVPAQFRKEVSFEMDPLRDVQTGDYRTAARVLFGCVLVLLALACANVANLLLARAAGKERERAVRIALGASRARMVQQALIEGVLVSSSGGVLGVAVAAALLRALKALAPGGLPYLQKASLDPRILAFTLVICVCCGLLFGLVPGMQRSRLSALTAVRSAGGGLRLRQFLVAVQVGLSVALLTGAGLLVRSLWKLQEVPLGMSPEHVLTAQLQLGQQYSSDAQRTAFFERALESLAGMPGLRAYALADSVPLSGPAFTIITNNMVLEGRPPIDPNLGTGGMVIDRVVTPGYFSALGVRILRGRAFTDSERNSPEQPVVMGETLAKKLWGDEDPIGRRFRPWSQRPEWRRVVGIAADVKNNLVTAQSDPEFYSIWATTERERRRAVLILRTGLDPAAMAAALRTKIAEIDPTLPVTISTMTERLDRHFERPRFQAVLLSLFAAIGIVLACAGQFGVMAAMVAQRSHEIGIRMAVGATPRAIVGLIVRHAGRWTITGAIAGIVAAMWGTRLLRSLLYGVMPADPGTLLAAIGVLTAASALAALVPSRRAARLDPARLLRHE